MDEWKLFTISNIVLSQGIYWGLVSLMSGNDRYIFRCISASVSSIILSTFININLL